MRRERRFNLPTADCARIMLLTASVISVSSVWSVWSVWSVFPPLVGNIQIPHNGDAATLPDAAPRESNFSVVEALEEEASNEQVALFSDDLRDSECLSPENEVSWALNGECEAEDDLLPTAAFSARSTGTVRYGNRTCGLCGEGDAVSHLRDLRDQIAHGYREKCQGSVVVYGAAFGRNYEKWMKNKNVVHPHNKEVADDHDGKVCFFQFVTNEGRGLGQMSADGSQVLVVVDASRLPYESNRRNTKIFKLNPGLFFPWAERVFWQDAKLLTKTPRVIPTDYSQYFDQAIARSGGACSSFMGLPHHRHTFVKGGISSSSSFDLMSHCKKIILASTTRPTVSDGLGVLLDQCKGYYRMYKESNQTTSSRVFHENPMVDSALIAWDMRSERCRQFNGNLGCSWLDEIHCYSDRDQVSFPAVLAASGLRRMDGGGDASGDSVYRDDEGPMLHIANPSCHWYYGNVQSCKRAREDQPDPSHGRRRKADAPIVAVVVAGTLERFMLGPLLEHVINPMIENDGAEVDYYISLTTSAGKAYRDGGYMSHVQPEAMLKKPLDGATTKFDIIFNIRYAICRTPARER